jgi:ABC-2 type transport system ATP-binding protein
MQQEKKQLKPILQIRGLHKEYGSKVVLKDLNLDIFPGEFVGLFGLNGAGKSTLLNSIVHLVRPQAGTIKINGYNVVTEHPQAMLNLGMMQQKPDMDTRMSAINILIIHAGFYGMSYQAAKQRGLELLKLVGLEGEVSLAPSQMSGGMNQRLMLAKAMMHKPSLLILDEVTAGVDFQATEAIYKYIKKLNEEEGVTIILTTHIIDKLANLCNKLVFLKKQRITVCTDIQSRGGYMVELDDNTDFEAFKKYCEGNKQVSYTEGEDAFFFQMNFGQILNYIKPGKFKIKNLRFVSGVEAQIIQNIGIEK